jgi:hypothetical protein
MTAWERLLRSVRPPVPYGGRFSELDWERRGSRPYLWKREVVATTITTWHSLPLIALTNLVRRGDRAELD